MQALIKAELDNLQIQFGSKSVLKKYTDLSYKAVTGKIARKLREGRGADPKATAIDFVLKDCRTRGSERSLYSCCDRLQGVFLL